MTSHTVAVPCPCGSACEWPPYPINLAGDLFRLDCVDAECGWAVISPSIDQALLDWNRRAQPAAEQDERRVSLTAPERIWLVIGDGCPDDADFSELSEVTWCEDNIDGNGIEYVRATDKEQP